MIFTRWLITARKLPLATGGVAHQISVVIKCNNLPIICILLDRWYKVVICLQNQILKASEREESLSSWVIWHTWIRIIEDWMQKSQCYGALADCSGLKLKSEPGAFEIEFKDPNRNLKNGTRIKTETSRNKPGASRIYTAMLKTKIGTSKSRGRYSKRVTLIENTYK